MATKKKETAAEYVDKKSDVKGVGDEKFRKEFVVQALRTAKEELLDPEAGDPDRAALRASAARQLVTARRLLLNGAAAGPAAARARSRAAVEIQNALLSLLLPAPTAETGLTFTPSIIDFGYVCLFESEVSPPITVTNKTAQTLSIATPGLEHFPLESISSSLLRPGEQAEEDQIGESRRDKAQRRQGQHGSGAWHRKRPGMLDQQGGGQQDGARNRDLSGGRRQRRNAHGLEAPSEHARKAIGQGCAENRELRQDARIP